jgi:hypothetical protein
MAMFLLPVSKPDHRTRAVKAHAAFLAEYGKTAEEVPMLIYDKKRCECYDRSSGCSCEGPFALFRDKGPPGPSTGSAPTAPSKCWVRDVGWRSCNA